MKCGDYSLDYSSCKEQDCPKRPRFIPRVISPEQAAQGYNNEGRGKLIGYISAQKYHETTCPHFKDEKATCACRVGLWQEEPKKVVKRKKK